MNLTIDAAYGNCGSRVFLNELVGKADGLDFMSRGVQLECMSSNRAQNHHDRNAAACAGDAPNLMQILSSLE